MKVNTDNVARTNPPIEPKADDTDRTGGAGNIIKDLRLKKCMTQGRLCELSKVSQSSLTQIEAGKQAISFLVFCQLIDALDVEFELTFSDKPRVPAQAAPTAQFPQAGILSTNR